MLFRFKNGTELEPSEHYTITLEDNGTATLLIINVTMDDSDVYTVKATNEAGEATCCAQLIVLISGTQIFIGSYIFIMTAKYSRIAHVYGIYLPPGAWEKVASDLGLRGGFRRVLHQLQLASHDSATIWQKK